MFNKLNAKLLQKKDKNKAASLSMNHIKQYCIVRYIVTTSVKPYILSVIISVNNSNSVVNKTKNNKAILIKSKKKDHMDKPHIINKHNIKYIRNNGE